jgi:hypothetical protein
MGFLHALPVLHGKKSYNPKIFIHHEGKSFSCDELQAAEGEFTYQQLIK